MDAPEVLKAVEKCYSFLGFPGGSLSFLTAGRDKSVSGAQGNMGHSMHARVRPSNTTLNCTSSSAGSHASQCRRSFVEGGTPGALVFERSSVLTRAESAAAAKPSARCTGPAAREQQQRAESTRLQRIIRIVVASGSDGVKTRQDQNEVRDER